MIDNAKVNANSSQVSTFFSWFLKIRNYDRTKFWGRIKPSEKPISHGFTSNIHDRFVRGHLWSTLVIWYMQNEHLVALCEAKYATMLKFQQDSTRTSENRVNQAFKQVFIERIHIYHVYNMCAFCKPCRFIESLCFQASTVIIVDLLHICPSGPVSFSINIQSP